MQLIESKQTLSATFSSKVKDNIRIRQQQLVAVDTSVSPPEISWRWFIGQVESTEGASASIRRLDQPSGSCESIKNADGVAVASGDLVFYGHGENWGIVSGIADGRPTNLDAFASKYLPEVEAFLNG